MIISYYERLQETFEVIERTFKMACSSFGIETELFTSGRSLIEPYAVIKAEVPMNPSWRPVPWRMALGYEVAKKISADHGIVPVYLDQRQAMDFAKFGFSTMGHLSSSLPPLKVAKEDKLWSTVLGTFHRENQTPLTIWDSITANILQNDGYNAHFTPLHVFNFPTPQPKEKKYDIVIITSKVHISEEELNMVLRQLRDKKVLLKTYPNYHNKDELNLDENVDYVTALLPKKEFIELISQAKTALQYSSARNEVFSIRTAEAAAFMPIIYVDNDVAPHHKLFSYNIRDLTWVGNAVDILLDDSDQYDKYLRWANDYTQYMRDPHEIADYWKPILEKFDKPNKRLKSTKMSNLDEWMT